jgi:hypothetical protein
MDLLPIGAGCFAAWAASGAPASRPVTMLGTTEMDIREKREAILWVKVGVGCVDAHAALR